MVALQKVPADRFGSAQQFADALEGRTPSRRPPVATTRRNSAALYALAAVTVLALMLAAYAWFRPAPAAPVARYSIRFPDPGATQGGLGVNLALSADGSRLIYARPSQAVNQLWLRRRDELDGTPIPGTTDARSPVFSPDGRQFAAVVPPEGKLQVFSLDGSAPTTVAVPGPGAGGGCAWGSDGYLYFDSDDGYFRVKATGGTPELVAPLDSARAELGLAWPDVLPGGRGIILRSRRSFDPSDFQIVAVDLANGERHAVTPGLLARYVAGHVVVVRADGSVAAVPFDLERLAVTGAPVALFGGVRTKGFGSVDFAVSPAGTIAYMPGPVFGGAGFTALTWVTRSGAPTLLDSAAQPIGMSNNFGLALAPDGSQLALDLLSSVSRDIWVKPLPAGPMTRLTFDGANARPVYTEGGRSIVYLSDRGGETDLWMQRADGTGEPRRVPRQPAGAVRSVTVSRDGRWLVYQTAGDDLMAMQASDSVAKAVVATRFAERAPELSPDGRWLAYVSNESGTSQVYVRPFPNTDGGRWQISTEGGIEPQWANSGRELFYRAFDQRANDLMSATIAPGSTFVLEGRRRLFGGLPFVGGNETAARAVYAVSPDDKRFLMMTLTQAVDSVRAEATIVVVENWLTELRAKAQKR
jgi:eukaryotic-like serine/threonine-protein kinase